MSDDEGRFDDEGSGPTQAARDEAEAQIDKVDELRDYLVNAARTVARELETIGMLDVKGLPGCDSSPEVIEGAAEEGDELFAKLLSKRALQDAIDTRDYEP